MKAKLLSVGRCIEVYDNDTEEKVDESELNISVEILKTILRYNEDDPDYYDGYIIDSTQFDQLICYSSKKIDFIPEKYYYVLTCWGNYE